MGVFLVVLIKQGKEAVYSSKLTGYAGRADEFWISHSGDMPARLKAAKDPSIQWVILGTDGVSNHLLDFL